MSRSEVQHPATGPVMTDPVRYPSGASSPVRTKRAFVLLLMTLLVPGSAQIVAGDRKLGRNALRVTLGVWAVLVATVLLLVVNRTLLINVITNPFASLVIIVVLVALALGWAFLFINTLRLIRPVLLAPGARPAVVISLVLALGPEQRHTGLRRLPAERGAQRHWQYLLLRTVDRSGGRPLQLPDDGR